MTTRREFVAIAAQAGACCVLSAFAVRTLAQGAAYKIGPVANGGTIEGIARLKGNSPDPDQVIRGCHLDQSALLEAVALASIGLAEGADMQVVNKFSKREAEGRGFRTVIEEAAGRGVPVLTTVNAEHLPMWQDFCGGSSPILEADAVAVREWCEAALARTRYQSNSVRMLGADAKPATCQVFDCQGERQVIHDEEAFDV